LLWHIKSITSAAQSLKKEISLSRLPIRLFEFLLQIRHGEPRDCLSQQMAFRLATTLAVPHRDSKHPRGVSPTGYEGTASPSRVICKEPLLPRRRRVCDDASLIRA
jgi:hypothetical protein